MTRPDASKPRRYKAPASIPHREDADRLAEVAKANGTKARAGAGVPAGWKPAPSHG